MAVLKHTSERLHSLFYDNGDGIETFYPVVHLVDIDDVMAGCFDDTDMVPQKKVEMCCDIVEIFKFDSA